MALPLAVDASSVVVRRESATWWVVLPDTLPSRQESGCFLHSREPPPRALQVEGYPDAGDPLVLLQHILLLLAINRSEQKKLDGLRAR